MHEPKTGKFYQSQQPSHAPSEFRDTCVSPDKLKLLVIVNFSIIVFELGILEKR
ncbi:hypothetical protein [Rivularia sp. UHCC 0363]|uniref:hypothetical protein n=1 Tax=Rivularia sp. UHCC 0363 TaxID=3110244 RepID=UPI002B2148BB|nr:hypothetical protein [Rivularia sp. UHCC 0363]MEA5594012.1 hypothetical protein [Rivularia sp. UHCC 0363]